jgi:hypothetical protein
MAMNFKEETLKNTIVVTKKIFLSIYSQNSLFLASLNRAVFIDIMMQDSDAQAPVSALERRKDFLVAISGIQAPLQCLNVGFNALVNAAST